MKVATLFTQFDFQPGNGKLNAISVNQIYRL
jgi:hypothetical protein